MTPIPFVSAPEVKPHPADRPSINPADIELFRSALGRIELK
jgi:hypothetical protein